MVTHGDVTATITASGTADAESAQSAISVNAGSRLKEITVCCKTVGQVYAVRIDFTGCPTPQKYVISSNGAPVTNGGKWYATHRKKIDIPLPAGITSVNVSVYADIASVTCNVGLKWESAS